MEKSNEVLNQQIVNKDALFQQYRDNSTLLFEQNKEKERTI